MIPIFVNGSHRGARVVQYVALFHWIWWTCVVTHNRVDLCWNLCTSLLYFVVRVRRKETSRSLSYLLMSFLYVSLTINLFQWNALGPNYSKQGLGAVYTVSQ